MPNTQLIAHNDQFKKTVISLAPGIWGAIGYAASNVYMIEGDTTVTIIDTSESTKAAENILIEFRKHCTKPVGRIIFTHSHRDHISGATVFADGGSVPVVASASFSSDLICVDENTIAPNKSLGLRTQAQFGIGLSADQLISLGCGPGDRPMQGLGAGFIQPTELIETDTQIDLDGIVAELIMAPGETADHMVVWLPEQCVLFSGDNWYHAFPNLYAIRGTPYRDFAVWADSLALLANLEPEVLAPGHTMPVLGAAKIQEVLTTTRAAILHVMKTTADAMDAGIALDDIVDTIALPNELQEKPWLGEYYGKIGWSARAFAIGSLGWYDGNPTNLGTISTRKRARHMIALAGGVDAVVKAAEDTDDFQWRLELCDHLRAIGYDSDAMKGQAMEQLAELEVNATARNTYLWSAKQLKEKN